MSESMPDGHFPIYLDAPVLTGMNLTTLPSKGFDLSATIGDPTTGSELKAGTDGLSGLWVQGMRLAEVSVWDLSGRLLERRPMNGADSYRASYPRGVYLIRAQSEAQTVLKQKVAVR
jgi:hypothetical protein